MPKIKTQVQCPNCGQSLVADLEQLFDVGADPSAKQRLLSGSANQADCPYCGYNGPLATPIVYHDPDKELLLTYTPPELNLPRDERERVIGAQIQQAVNNLPQEERKGYLFNPQEVLTLQGLIERILEADGVTKEMIDSQRERVQLIQRLAEMSDEALEAAVKENDELIDTEFFNLLGTLAQASAASGDESSAVRLNELMKKIIPLSSFGQQYEEQTREIEAAAKSLQEAGENLTREKLLDLVMEAPNEARLGALVGLARGGMDYQFFQELTNRIEAAVGEEKQRLQEVRENLLEMTREIDQQVERRMAQANQNLENLLEAEDIAEATKQNLGAVDDFFLEALNRQYEAAMQANDNAKLEKLNQVIQVVQEATMPGGALLRELLEAPDAEARKGILKAHRDEITPEFVESLTNLLVQLEGGKDKAMKEKVREIYRTALRMSMQTSMEE